MKPIDSFDPKDLILWLDKLDRRVLPASMLDPGPDPYLRLQCDVDLSMVWAWRLAELLSAAEIAATFSVLVGGAFYDLTSAHSLEGLDRISALGHDFALHFDPRRYLHRHPDLDPPTLAVAAGIRQDRAVLESLGFPAAFCNPHRPLRLSFDYAMLDDVDLPTPDLPGETYLSDSAKGFRDDTAAALDDPPDHVRLCLHPAWWIVDAPRKQTIQARLSQIAQHLSADAGEWGQIDDHPGAREQDARDARSGNPKRKARAAASPHHQDPEGGGGRVVMPTAVEVAAAGRSNGKRT